MAKSLKLALGLISCCFCVGIGIGLLIRISKSHVPTNTGFITTTSQPAIKTDTALISANSKLTIDKSVIIQAVGDVIPGESIPLMTKHDKLFLN